MVSKLKYWNRHGVITIVPQQYRKRYNFFHILYIPDLNENLISVNKARKSDVKVVFEWDKAKIYCKTGTLLFTVDQSRALYIVSKGDRVLIAHENNSSLNLCCAT